MCKKNQQSLEIIQKLKWKNEVLGQKSPKLFNRDLQWLIWKLSSRGSWIWQVLHLISMPKCQNFKLRFKEIEARKNVRVIYMAFLPQKRTQCFSKFGILSKLLALIELSFLNRWVTQFWLPALAQASRAL